MMTVNLLDGTVHVMAVCALVPAVCLHAMSCATPSLPPSVQQEVGRQEAAEVRCSLLGTVWWSCGLNEY